jgi:hypothetical protein
MGAQRLGLAATAPQVNLAHSIHQLASLREVLLDDRCLFVEHNKPF